MQNMIKQTEKFLNRKGKEIKLSKQESPSLKSYSGKQSSVA